MAMLFKYKSVKRPDGTMVSTPSIPLTLIGKESIDTICLVDSGADISALSKDFAEILGLDLSGEKTKAFGIGGAVDSVETKLTIKIRKGHENYSFLIPVKVILGNYDFPVLLGRAGFFDEFKIIFHQKKKKVWLKKVS